MQRGPFFLAAAFVEVLRFFFLMFFADAIGLLDSGSITPSLLRYIAAPQLLFVVSLFFLWLDRPRYATFRPLSLMGKILSLIAFAPLMLAFFLSLRSEGFIPLPRFALLSAFIIVGADFFTLLVLILYRRAPSAPATIEATKADTAPELLHGSEDIERVEALP